MSGLKFFIFAVLSLVLSVPTGAVYNANMSGKINKIAVYTAADYIYIQLENQPTSHPSCNPAWFVVEASTSIARIDRLYSRAMAAKATGETLNIGYDSQGDCAHGYIRVHRVG